MKKVIIVGAGILGVSTAYHLAKAGVEVTLIDGRDEGRATDAAAGIICPWLSQRRNKSWYQLARRGACYYDPFIKELEEMGETDHGYKKVGAISIHTDGKKLDQMEERAQKRRVDAPEIGEIKRLTNTETLHLFPLLAADYGSVYVSGAARVNGSALRQAIENAALKKGITLIHGEAHLSTVDGQIREVRVDGKQLKAETVVVTAGAWADKLLAQAKLRYKGTFQKGQIIHLQLPSAQTAQWPVVMPPSDQYLLAFEDGRIVIGTTHENDTGYDTRITAGGMHEILDKALSVAPGLANAAYLETRVGFRPYTPGFLPMIGAVPAVQGLYIANGLGASGLTMGPYLGDQLAKLVLGLNTEINPQEYAVSAALE